MEKDSLNINEEEAQYLGRLEEFERMLQRYKYDIIKEGVNSRIETFHTQLQWKIFQLRKKNQQ